MSDLLRISLSEKAQRVRKTLAERLLLKLRIPFAQKTCPLQKFAEKLAEKASRVSSRLAERLLLKPCHPSRLQTKGVPRVLDPVQFWP
jgi:hypothetical protein